MKNKRILEREKCLDESRKSKNSLKSKFLIKFSKTGKGPVIFAFVIIVIAIICALLLVKTGGKKAAEIKEVTFNEAQRQQKEMIDLVEHQKLEINF